MLLKKIKTQDNFLHDGGCPVNNKHSNVCFKLLQTILLFSVIPLSRLIIKCLPNNMCHMFCDMHINNYYIGCFPIVPDSVYCNLHLLLENEMFPTVLLRLSYPGRDEGIDFSDRRPKAWFQDLCYKQQPSHYKRILIFFFHTYKVFLWRRQSRTKGQLYGLLCNRRNMCTSKEFDIEIKLFKVTPSSDLPFR